MSISFFICSALVSGVILYLWIERDFWVNVETRELIDRDYNKYKKLPSYWVMMFKFWITDIEDFIKDK